MLGWTAEGTQLLCEHHHWMGRLEHVHRTLQAGLVASATELDMGVGRILTINFFKKWEFLRVILSDPSTLIQYWKSGDDFACSVPPVVELILDDYNIMILKRTEVICILVISLLHCISRDSLHSVELHLSIQNVVCKG